MSNTRLNYLTVRRLIQSTPYARDKSAHAADLSSAIKRLMDANRRLISAARDNRGLMLPMVQYSIEVGVKNDDAVVKAVAQVRHATSTSSPPLGESEHAERPSVINPTEESQESPGVSREFQKSPPRTYPVLFVHGAQENVHSRRSH